MTVEELESIMAKLTKQVQVLYRVTQTSYWECTECGTGFSGKPYASDMQGAFGEGICESCYKRKKHRFESWFVLEGE